MDEPARDQRIDIGRLFIVPVFVFLMSINVYIAFNAAKDLFPLTAGHAVQTLNQVLVICFYAFIIVFYFQRRSAISTHPSLLTKGFAIAATFIPFAFPLLRRTPLNNPARLLIANLFFLAGMALSVYAIKALGKSISIVPQARSLVRNGPYRVVRHPLYLSELIGAFGIALSDATLPIVALFILLAGLQLYRAVEEEKLLRQVFPEYEEYCSNTTRLIPGLF